MATNNSSTKQRQITCYPSMKYFPLVKAYSEIKDLSNSEVGAMALKKLIDDLPPAERKKVETVAKKYQSKNSY